MPCGYSSSSFAVVIFIKGSPASFAIASPSKVFPVPGGPDIMQPGIRFLKASGEINFSINSFCTSFLI